LLFFAKLITKPLVPYEFIYINHAPFAIPVFLRPSLYKKGVVIHWHGNELVLKNFYLKFALSFLKSRIQNMLHIVPSLYFQNELKRTLGINEDRIKISPSGGIDTCLFVPSNEKRKNREIAIGFASALSKPKGSDLILEILRKRSIVEANINKPVEFHVIDYGSDKNEFIKICNDENLPVYIYNKMPKEKMVAYYNSLDILLMPSRRESLGLVALEAMSCNIPVIAYDICAFPEYVIPGKSGLLITPYEDRDEDIEAFINAIIFMFHNKNNFNPRSIILDNYSTQRVIKQYEGLLKWY
jgi:glycosyltransferase involved in cell wall biosynthesis